MTRCIRNGLDSESSFPVSTGAAESPDSTPNLGLSSGPAILTRVSATSLLFGDA